MKVSLSLILFGDRLSNCQFIYLAIPPNISVKETFKYIMNTKLCKLTGKTLEPGQNGILVNVFFEHESEQMEIHRLGAIAPDSVKNNSNK